LLTSHICLICAKPSCEYEFWSQVGRNEPIFIGIVDMESIFREILSIIAPPTQSSLRQKPLKAKTLELTMTSLNAALYAGIGYLTFLGIFAPIVGVVRFWGIAVIIPSVFAALFGPLVGGIGAAIGIFISDMLVHGNALLSVTVGVPANFAMFYLIGYISQRTVKVRTMNIGVAAGCIAIVLVFLVRWVVEAQTDLFSALLIVLFSGLSIILMVAVNKFWPKWRSFAVGSIVGNGIGSAIVGVGVWAFSQFFLLPGGMGSHLPLSASLIWFVWTFSNQMPFLLIFGPPILNACSRAFPSLTGGPSV